jgi:hypothetical protein
LRRKLSSSLLKKPMQACTRFLGRIAQSTDTIDKQGVPTLKKIDREEPASSRSECTTTIWHPCKFVSTAQCAAFMKP